VFLCILLIYNFFLFKNAEEKQIGIAKFNADKASIQSIPFSFERIPYMPLEFDQFPYMPLKIGFSLICH
jgi:hypothetical protein